MDANLKSRWIEALRSGKYEQGSGQLKDHSGNYCCLGVLCAIQDIDLEFPPRGCNSGRYGDYSFPENGHAPGLYDEVTGDDASYRSVLARMNDDGHTSFSNIADWIENNIPTT